MGEVLLNADEFFAPAPTDMISGLVAHYDAARKQIEAFVTLYKEESLSGVIHYFCQQDGDRQPSFSLSKAIWALNSEYWSKAFAMTDVYESMPQARRDAWGKQMTSWRNRDYKPGNPEEDLPDFTEEVVRLTLGELMNSRSRFFAERVDGVFRKLSKEHVTNCPQGFSVRMIIGYVHNGSYENHSACGYINDLRSIVAKFMGRSDPAWHSTSRIVKEAMGDWGQWKIIDGGALKLRVYKKGTAHLEVHPDMAWRLNGVLASIYPAAIPESFRRKPVKLKPTKEWPLMQRPLPSSVVEQIIGLEPAREYIGDGINRNTRLIPNAVEFRYGQEDKAGYREAIAVLEAVGAAPVKKGEGHWVCYQFDYDPSEVISEIVCSGCLPDQKTHQFFPTPEAVALAAIESAGIEEGHRCLEPSAGMGGIADFLPKDRTDCVEVSRLHAQILSAKGFKSVVNADFIAWAKDKKFRYDRVVMNPPYEGGRWQLHTETAAKLVKTGGRLVAILPASAKNKFDLPGFNCEWSRVYENEFQGTGISVVILTANKP